MKRIVCGVLAILAAMIGLILLLNTLYNVDGLAGFQDGGSGSKAELALVSCLFAILTVGAFFISYRLFRRAVRTNPN